MKKSASLLCAATFAFGAAGCGSGTEPLSAIGTSDATPQLNLPATTTGVNTIIPYNASGTGTANDGFDMTWITPGQSVLSPGPGIVFSVDNTAGAAVVTIYHNVHLMSRLSRMQSTSVQPGAIVSAGSVLGVSSSTVSEIVHFTVFFDNNIVCPYGFLASADQRFVNLRLGGLAACQ